MKTQQTVATYVKQSLESAFFPPEFVGILNETAQNSLRDYLRANGLSESAIQLVRSIAVLATYETIARLNHDHVSPFDNELLADIVPEVTRDIVAIGGVFWSNTSVSVPRSVDHD